MEAEFRRAVRSGQFLLGGFIKTASHQVVELMARAGQDFAVVDAEHAPFDLLTLDRMAMAGTGARLPLLIRPATVDSAFIGQALDLGISGVLAPHVEGPERVQELLAAARFDRGKRGFSPSTRAGNYGAPDAAAYRRAADEATSIWCQIEDAAAIPRLDAIAADDRVDCLFLGRADLAASLGVEGQADPKVMDAVRQTAKVGRRHGRAVGVYVASATEIRDLQALGISVFVCGSDQSWIISQGKHNRTTLDGG